MWFLLSTSNFEISESLVEAVQASQLPECLFYLWIHLILTTCLGCTMVSSLQERKQVPRSGRPCPIHPANKWHCLHATLLVQAVYSFHHIMQPCLPVISKHCTCSIDVIAVFNSESERRVAEREIDGGGESRQGSLRTHFSIFLLTTRDQNLNTAVNGRSSYLWEQNMKHEIDTQSLSLLESCAWWWRHRDLASLWKERSSKSSYVVLWRHRTLVPEVPEVPEQLLLQNYLIRGTTSWIFLVDYILSKWLVSVKGIMALKSLWSTPADNFQIA